MAGTREITQVLAFLCFSFCLVSSVLANEVNLYQTCTNAGNNYSDPSGYFYWYNPKGPISSLDAGNMALPASEHYSFALDDGRVVYFNICTGSTICDGGAACIIAPDGSKILYAYPNGDPLYSASTLYQQGVPETKMTVDYHKHNGGFRSAFIYITCDPTEEVLRVVFDENDDRYMTIYMTSPEVCTYKQVSTFVAPQNYTSLTAPLHLAGNLPMFAKDFVAGDGTSFIGTVLYSSIYNSFKIEGTLSNNQGESNEVAYLYSGNQSDGSPPITVTRITYPGDSEPSCVVLKKLFDFDDDDYEVNWFGTDSSQNNFQSLTRNYTSVYFDKGATFPIHVYSDALDRTEITLTQTQSGSPIFVGVYAMCPFLGFREVPRPEATPFMISEFDWTSLDSTPLKSSVFDIPADWNCNI